MFICSLLLQRGAKIVTTACKGRQPIKFFWHDYTEADGGASENKKSHANTHQHELKNIPEASFHMFSIPKVLQRCRKAAYVLYLPPRVAVLLTMMIDVECLCCNLWMATKNAMTWCHCRFFPVDSCDHNPGLAICPKHVGCHLRRELFPQAAINLSSGVEILMKSHTNKPLPTMLERSYQSAVPWCLCIPDIHPHQDYSLWCAYDLIDCAKQQCSWRRLQRALHGKHPKLHKPKPDSRPCSH